MNLQTHTSPLLAKNTEKTIIITLRMATEEKFQLKKSIDKIKQAIYYVKLNFGKRGISS